MSGRIGTQLDEFARVSVIVPALNEARNIPHVFSRLPDGLHEIILVDGHSDDDTVHVARQLRPDIIVVTQTRRGKGNALACGFAEATGDIIVMLDADGSADPAEIPTFVQALLDGADFAKGSRFRKGGRSEDITRLRRLGNRGLNEIVNRLYGTQFTDLCYGYNAFWRNCLTAISVEPGAPSSEMQWGDGFEIETIINIRAAQNRLRVAEVPSFEHHRLYGTSNLNAFTDGLRVLRTILVERRLLRTRRPANVEVSIDLTDAERPLPANVIDLTDQAIANQHDSSGSSKTLKRWSEVAFASQLNIHRAGDHTALRRRAPPREP